MHVLSSLLADVARWESHLNKGTSSWEESVQMIFAERLGSSSWVGARRGRPSLLSFCTFWTLLNDQFPYSPAVCAASVFCAWVEKIHKIDWMLTLHLFGVKWRVLRFKSVNSFHCRQEVLDMVRKHLTTPFQRWVNLTPWPTSQPVSQPVRLPRGTWALGYRLWRNLID